MKYNSPPSIDEFLKRLKSCSQTFILEAGGYNPIYYYISECIPENIRVIYISLAYINYIDNINILCNLLQATSYLCYDITSIKHGYIGALACSHQDLLVRECGVSIIENTNDKDLVFILESMLKKETEKWFINYINGVIHDLNDQEEILPVCQQKKHQ